MLEFTGILTQATPVQTVGANGTQKRLIVVHEDGAYPKDVAFELFGKNVGLADNITAGTKVRVCFDVKSREYNGKWYNDISAYRVEPAAAVVSAQAAPYVAPQQVQHSVPTAMPDAMPPQYAQPAASDGDDLPF